LRGQSDPDHVAYEALIVSNQDVGHRTSQRASLREASAALQPSTPRP